MLPKGGTQAVLAATHVSSSSALYPGRQVTFANDLDIAEDGTIYFTSSTPVLPPLSAKGYWDMARGWQLDLLGVRRPRGSEIQGLGFACARCAPPQGLLAARLWGPWLHSFRFPGCTASGPLVEKP
jgi:hypothetical protein